MLSLYDCLTHAILNRGKNKISKIIFVEKILGKGRTGYETFFVFTTYESIRVAKTPFEKKTMSISLIFGFFSKKGNKNKQRTDNPLNINFSIIFLLQLLKIYRVTIPMYPSNDT